MAIVAAAAPASFLTRVVRIDALVSGAAGALQLAAAAPLSQWLALDAGLLRGSGAVLLAWVGFLAWVLARRPLVAARVWAVVAVNLAWVAASVGLLLTGLASPNALGLAYVLAQAVVVAVFAELQILGLRRLRRS